MYSDVITKMLCDCVKIEHQTFQQIVHKRERAITCPGVFHRDHIHQGVPVYPVVIGDPQITDRSQNDDTK